MVNCAGAAFASWTAPPQGCVIGEHYPAPVDKNGPASKFADFAPRSAKGKGKGGEGKGGDDAPRAKRWKGSGRGR